MVPMIVYRPPRRITTAQARIGDQGHERKKEGKGFSPKIHAFANVLLPSPRLHSLPYSPPLAADGALITRMPAKLSRACSVRSEKTFLDSAQTAPTSGWQSSGSDTTTTGAGISEISASRQSMLIMNPMAAGTQHKAVHQRHQPHAAGHAHRVDIVDGPGHQIPRFSFCEKMRERQGLNMAVKTDAQPLFHFPGMTQQHMAPHIAEKNNTKRNNADDCRLPDQ